MSKFKSILASLFIISTLALSNQVLADNAQTKVEKSSSKITTVQENKKSIDKNDPIILSDKVNINTATASEIQQALTGIGEKKAIAIVAYRQENGNFTDIEQLTEVKGIGKATLEKNKDRIIL
ncbi:competence protein ComEA [Bisgaardia hudsonensis]|uniref:Competence protein ComEA n=1 Tax=Bisgaardia hudsonensis TaxID=109472 RepID=A0A4R2MTS6_9PAST|nr:helix-hairpin-helix domain-containing protein [Bisgaardia hudsonensis]QLB13612.1 hypothetical protein A6A11_08340 [Bisgaardia hudsonensis]TCP11944.1 competence protein ComEA [Bisgaardia hudsonensis]